MFNLTELLLIIRFKRHPQRYLNQLTQHMLARTDPLTRWNCPLIHHCLDIFGYEISIGLFPGPWLDTRPQHYGINRVQADRLFKAICSCIPGSTNHQIKKHYQENNNVH